MSSYMNFGSTICARPEGDGHRISSLESLLQDPFEYSEANWVSNPAAEASTLLCRADSEIRYLWGFCQIQGLGPSRASASWRLACVRLANGLCKPHWAASRAQFVMVSGWKLLRYMRERDHNI